MPLYTSEGHYSSEEEFEDAIEATESVEADIDFLDIDFSDIPLPSPSHFAIDEWTDDRCDVLRSVLGTVYEGHVQDGCKVGFGKLWDAGRKQYIDGEWRDDRLVDFNFAQFQINDSDFVRLNGLDDLITSNKHHFVARISKQPLDIICGHFSDIRQQIESRIRITKILDDDLKNELKICRERFEVTLNSRVDSVTKSRTAQRDMYHLFLLNNCMEREYDYEDENENMNVLRKIYQTNEFSEELRKEASDARLVEQNAYDRNKNLPIMKLSDISFSWKNVFKRCIKDSVSNIKKSLQQTLPSRAFIYSGPEDIDNLHNQQFFTCNTHDIQLFADLEFTTLQHLKSQLHNINFREFLHNYVTQLWKLLITKIKNTVLADIPDMSVYTNSVFLQLFKTFLELLNDICSQSGEQLKQLISIQKTGDLQMIECLGRKIGIMEQRLEFLIKLMNHFKPGDIKNNKFNYKFSFFEIQQNILKRFYGYITNYFANDLTNISQERVIWLYYIHSSFHNLFGEIQAQDNENKNGLFYFFNSLMNLFKTVITNFEVSLEKIRIFAKSVIKFGITISPYFLEDTGVNEEHMGLLLKQAEYIKDFITVNERALDDITNIVDIYQVFWDERKNLFTDIRRNYSNGVASSNVLILKFNEFVDRIFNLKIYNNSFLIFLRAYNEFIRLLRGTNICWYIKKSDFDVASSEDVDLCLELVDNDMKSYLVKNIERFLQECLNNSKDPPRHYLLDVTIHFIECIEKFLNRNDWNVNDKIQASSDLLLLMGRSLISFAKLPNAVDFDKFFVDFTEPFDRVTVYSVNVNDFKRRLGSLESYYKYTLSMNEMSVNKALQLCKQNITSCHSEINYSIESSILESCYKVYLDKFNTYVADYILQPNFKITKLIDKVKSKVKPSNIDKWTSETKQKKLPKLLAGLSAVWSALESIDVICQKKVIKPHCIQILCILRLLGVDQDRTGFSSHLAQVLTGQGKSIVLSLLGAVLALTGNRVRVVCYNKYLAERDQNDFREFYKSFNIENTINYGTFEDMANEILEPVIQGKNYGLRKFVNKLITGELDHQLYVREEGNKVMKTVLLIDEVDVFFSPMFYGNTYNPCETIHSEALGDLQIKLWNLTETTCNKVDLKENIQKYIDEVFPQSTDITFKNIVKDSRSILNSHVDEMISNAVSVRNSNPGDWFSRKYKLRDDGLITTIEDSGEHSTTTFYRYRNIFMYFKLKRNNYEQKNFVNYGYLNVISGSVSYAMLPKDYHSILGVTGTLKQLSDVEVRAVTSYNITRGSDMPTFFGSNKLRVTNFSIQDTAEAWITAILDSILSHVEQGRAMIVFFEDEHIIDSLRDKFSRHLSRYSVLTGNETAQEVATIVEEAGIARKVTIATRWMGRGVDFKSNDSAVEAAGGVHVIHTFWSEDVKEETQIRGRTARKDNKGSYEAIICREHLAKAGYEDSACSYGALSAARERLVQEKETVLQKNIESSQKKHEATMIFLRSFFTYNPNQRNEYFQKYPFVDTD